MAISRISLRMLLLMAVPVATPAAETASPQSCQAAAAQPAIADAKAAALRDPQALRLRFRLADAWSDAGCFSEAVQVLQQAQSQRPESQELETRLRVAKSLVGEQSYFETLDRADAEARLKRDAFRCSKLSDLEACNESVRLRPDDPALLSAYADALVMAKRPAEAVGRYRRAASLAPGQTELAVKIAAAESQLRPAPPRAGAAPAGTAPAGTAPAAPTFSSVAASTRRAAAPRVARADANLPQTRQYSNLEPQSKSH